MKFSILFRITNNIFSLFRLEHGTEISDFESEMHTYIRDFREILKFYHVIAFKSTGYKFHHIAICYLYKRRGRWTTDNDQSERREEKCERVREEGDDQRDKNSKIETFNVMDIWINRKEFLINFRLIWSSIELLNELNWIALNGFMGMVWWLHKQWNSFIWVSCSIIHLLTDKYIFFN